MKCPVCQSAKTMVKRTQKNETKSITERQRMCAQCGEVFFTVEISQPPRSLQVIKRNGNIAQFQYENLFESIQKTFKGLGVIYSDQREIFLTVMDEITSKAKSTRKIKTLDIGELVLAKLYNLNKTAWLRYMVHFYDNEDEISEKIRVWLFSLN